MARLTSFAKVAKAVALVGFVLPWVTVSCAGQNLASFTGVGLGTGVITIRNPVTGVPQTHSGSPEVIVLIAGFAILFALFVSFAWPRRKAALAGLIGCGFAALLIWYEVFTRVPQQLTRGVQQRQGTSGGFNAQFDASMAQMVKVEAAGGFWLTWLALVSAIVLNWVVLQRTRNAAVDEIRATPPPPESSG